MAARTIEQFRVPGSSAFTEWVINSQDIVGGYDEANRNPRIFTIDSNEISLFDGLVDTDDTVGTFSWEGGEVNLMDKGKWQQVLYLTALVSLTGVSYKNITIGYNINGTETTYNVVLTNEEEIKIRVAKRTKYIKPIFRLTGETELVKLIGLHLQSKDVGRR